MRNLNESLFNHQIYIPPSFPHVLKIYAKAAIRTQPYDLLLWSASYFKALADGKTPPVKSRLEYPLLKSNGGLTIGYLKLLLNQVGNLTEIPKVELENKWKDICLNESELEQIIWIAGVYNDSQITFYKFVAVAAGFLSKSLTQTMIMLCELYTKEPEGGSAAISSDLFIQLYVFLASIDATKKYKVSNGQIYDTETEQRDVTTEKTDTSLATNKVDPKSKGIVNPIIKGLFDDVSNKLGGMKLSSDENEKIQELEGLQIFPIPGIGPIVDTHIVDLFLNYVHEIASDQGNMFMPRNIRHYLCPPLQKL